MKYTTAIFDLDGTLLDTLADLALASNSVLAECGYPQHPMEKYRFFVGDGLKTLMERIVPEGSTAEVVASCCRLFEKIYDGCWAQATRPYPGIDEMLVALEEKGIDLAILSNKPHSFTTACVQHFFPDVPFKPVFGVRDGVNKKPDPAGALEIADILQVNPQECIYVGDTSVDMQTGKSAGMFTIGVEWGFRPRHELEANNADLIVTTPQEIVRYVAAAH